MVAYIFVRVRNFSSDFVTNLLMCCMPQRDNIVDPRTESTLISEYMYELQTKICGELERITNRLLSLLLRLKVLFSFFLLINVVLGGFVVEKAKDI